MPQSVLHIVDSLDLSGGTERQLSLNLHHFGNPQLEHSVLQIVEADDSRRLEIEQVAEVKTLFSGSDSFTRLDAIRKVRDHIRRKSPDLVHASLALSSLATRFAIRSGDTRGLESLVNISHEPLRTVDNPSVSALKLRIHAQLDRWTMRSMTGFHAVSNAVADSWAQVVGLEPSRIRTIPRAIQIEKTQTKDTLVEETRASVRDEFGLPPGALVVLAVGRIEAQKGHRYLVQAMEKLANEVEMVHLIIVGRDGGASDLVRASIADLQLERKVTLAGARRDIDRLLLASDIFAFPSLFEGNGGNAMIEAMAAGLAIVTTGEEPMTDLIPDESIGLLVPRFDAVALTDALLSLATNKTLRHSLGSSAANRARSFAGPAEIARKHEEFYFELLSH